MENNLKNLSAKVWTNLDNPIKSYDFLKVLINFLNAAISGDTLLTSVMSQQYNFLMKLYTNFTKFLLFMKIHLPPTFIFRYVRPEIIVHAFVIELDQPDC